MEAQKVDWFVLSDDERVKFLERVKIFLRNQVSEAKFCRVVTEFYNCDAE